MILALMRRLYWILFKRFLLTLTVEGFSASILSFANRKTIFSEYCKINNGVELNNVTLGRFTYIAQHTKINNTVIGSFCSIASDVRIGFGIHPVDFLSSSPVFYSTKGQLNISFIDREIITQNKQTFIGNDVWIGLGAIILDGVNIGNGAIIGAGAVVTKDVPEYAIAGGVPAKIIKMRFPPNQIDQIKKLDWYNWSVDKLNKNSELFTISVNALHFDRLGAIAKNNCPDK